jgi:hypothetical protein
LNHFKLAENLNVLPMLKEVAMQWDDFNLETGRQDTIECQRMTQSINLRKAKLHNLHINDTHTTTDTETYARYPKVREFMNWFTEQYGGEVYRIAIVHLPKDGVVDAHIDEGDYYADKDRFHLVLSGYYENIVITPPQLNTEFEGDEIELYSAGELWWFNNKEKHHVKNKSELSRIAIIFDVKNSKWRN